ncbi:hypothetical protein N8475_08035 [Winogradskyella sp.]|nr:hypothetical protein [Winogradskyella sp.]
MDKQIELTTKIIEYLNKHAKYALLRNYEGLPEINSSRDIDIVIDKKDFFHRKKELEAMILSSNYRIFTYYLSDRMITYILINSEFEFLQFDFFFKTSIHGIILIKSNDLLGSREFNGKLYHVSKEYEFLDKYIYLKSLNLDFPSKYKDTRESVLSNEKNFDITISKSFGIKSFSKLESLSSKKLLTKLFFKNFVGNIFSVLNNIYLQLCNLLNSQGVSISFTGPDGVGKTTVIDKLIHLLTSHHSEVHLFHHRPTVIGNISNVAKEIGVLEKINDNYTEPHRGKKKGVFSSFLRLCYYSVDYIFGYWLKIKKPLFRREVVIFDRYYTDIIADSRRSSIYLNRKFLYYWGKVFIPKMNYNFLFTADVDVILGRKQELDKKGIEDINSKLNYLSNKKGYYLIKNNGTADEAIKKIFTILIKNQHSKNLKRL